MTSYHNDPAIKAKYIARVIAHQQADNLIQGYGYWEDGKGCAVGCTVEQDDGPHYEYSKQLGLPRWLARQVDGIFEDLPLAAAREWPLQFLQAVPVGIAESQLMDLFGEYRRSGPWISGTLAAAAHDIRVETFEANAIARRDWLLTALNNLTTQTPPQA